MRVYSREQLLDLVWGRDTFVEPRTVDVHVRRLRQHIERDDANPELILTVRSVGYRFNPEALDSRLRGLFTPIALSLAPAATLLIFLAATGGSSPVWVAVVILASGFCSAAIPAITIGRSLRGAPNDWKRLPPRCNIGAPPHLLPDGSDPMGRAEHHLLDTSDAFVTRFDSLDEQREEFEAILRSMTEAVVVTGARGEVMLINGAARRIFALGADTDYRGRPFVELCRDPRLQEFAGPLCVSGNDVLSGEFMIQIPAPLHRQASAAPIRHRAAAAWVLVFHDITRLKAYETARTDFIANLTHELRTPLSALCGYAETLVQGVEDRETERRFLGNHRSAGAAAGAANRRPDFPVRLRAGTDTTEDGTLEPSRVQRRPSIWCRSRRVARLEAGSDAAPMGFRISAAITIGCIR